MGKLFNQRNEQISRSVVIDSITLGTVIATNDPHQMGRLKILCQSFGDDPDDLTGANLPWATYVSPLGGMVNSEFKRGAGEGQSSKGPVAYGMWGIPKRGTTVLVCCVDGDPYYRVWMGCIFDQGAASSLPHGRFFYNGHGGSPEGPLDGYEDAIEPLHTNMQTAFKNTQNNYEWRTRGADFSASGNHAEYTGMSPSDTADETDKTTFTSADGKTFDVKNGYAVNQLQSQEGEDNSVYSWTSPGFHSISMDDRPENCRIRIRTTAGAQLILDDTNERVYISTPQGNNWVEMDYNGSVQIYGKDLSLRAEDDVNITAGKSIRMYADEGIHMVSKAELNIQVATALNVQADGVQVKSDGDANVTASGGLNLKAGSNANLQGGGSVNLKASGNVVQSGASILLNSGAAADATAASPEDAKLTNRLPAHEPYARVMTKDDTTHDPEFTYDDPSVGTSERGKTITRGKYWRR